MKMAVVTIAWFGWALGWTASAVLAGEWWLGLIMFGGGIPLWTAYWMTRSH